MADALKSVPGVRIAAVYRYPDSAVVTRTLGRAPNNRLEEAVRNVGFWGRVVRVDKR